MAQVLICDSPTVAPNPLDRRFAAGRPDTVWPADISHLPTDEG